MERKCSVCMGLDLFVVLFAFFPHFGYVQLYLLQVNSSPEIMAALGQSVELWSLFFFQHDVEKMLCISLYYMGTPKFWWQIWQHMGPDLGTLSCLSAPFCAEVTLDVGTRLSYQLNYHSQSKPEDAFEQKIRPLRAKPKWKKNLSVPVLRYYMILYKITYDIKKYQVLSFSITHM